jgi:hypothetical protein
LHNYFNLVNILIAKKNVVHFDHIFAITMRLMSKPTYFTTSNVLILCVHVIVTCCNMEVQEGLKQILVVDATTTYN